MNLPMPSTHPIGLSRRANHAILGATLAFSGFGTGALIFLAPQLRAASDAAACLIYGATLVASALFSFLYHVLETTPRRALLRLLDHGTIFLLIAGTYTPFTVIAARGTWSLFVLAAVWTAAFLGILLKIALREQWDRVFVGIYLALGGVFMIDFDGLFGALPPQPLMLLLAGCAAYVVGAVVYWRDVGSWTDPVWHALVLIGCSTHYFAIVSILPAA